MNRPAIWTPSAQDELLLKAALWSGERGLDAWARWRRGAPDIDDLDHGSYRLLPLVYSNLGPLLDDDPDAGRLKGVYRRSWAANQMVLKKGRVAIDALQAGEIKVLVLKGGALIGAGYERLGARPMIDLDLAVPPTDVGRAVAALEGAGFEPSTGDPVRALEVRHSLGFLDADEQEIDLHSGMLWRAGLDQDFWQAAVPIEVGGARLLALSPPDQLLHVCVHGAAWNPVQPFRWVADAFMVLRAAGDGFDWDRVVELATRGHLTLPMRDAISFLEEEMDVPVADGVVDRLAAVPVTGRERRAHEALAQPPSSRRSLAMLWWFWERHRAQASLAGERTSLAGMVRYLQGFWELDRPSQVPGYAVRRLARRRT